jgi:adenine-specific DNA-methyltransferase
VAFKDMWGKGTDSYLHMMYERLRLMRELLREEGTIVVHVDWRVASMIKLLLDDIFAPEFLINEIIWHFTGAGVSPERFARRHNNLFWYANGKKWYFDPDPLRTDYAEATKERFSHYIGNVRDGVDFGQQELNPKGKHPDSVVKVSIEAPSSNERTGYNTQKPLVLLEKLVAGLCPPDGIVCDVFCGSGTTLKAAEASGRRWIGCDLGRFAIHTSRKRLIELQRTLHAEGKPYRAFDVYNLGRYERQWWQKGRLKGAEEEHRRVVLEFFKAEVLVNAPSPLLHGRKAGAFCHVDGIDSVFTRGEATAVAKAVAQAGGREAYCLAWEFEMELRQHCLALEAELGVKLKLIPIPREIMEKNRTSPPPFLEMAVLEAEPVFHGKSETRNPKSEKRLVDVKLTKFLPSLAEVPSKELAALKERAIKSGMDFVDFWAVDFEWQPGQPFNHHWQDYRTRKDRSLKTVSDAGHVYDTPGKHTICVKVVDVFGCDTSITVEVKA